MSSKVYIICMVLVFIHSKILVTYSDGLHLKRYQNSVAADHQSTEPHIEKVGSQPGSSLGCPQQCSCWRNNTHHIISVDCSSKGLTMVPDLPETTIQLFLMNNSISNITCQSFIDLNFAFNKIHRMPLCIKPFQNLSHLETLDLSRNVITHLASRTFSDLVQLVDLDLSFNLIESIAPDAFKGLFSLKTLSLLNNLLDHTDSFHKNVFQDLGALEILDVKANLGSIDEAVSALRNVSHLYIEVNNNYEIFGTGFRHLTSLQVLNLDMIDFGFQGQYKSLTDCCLCTAPMNFFVNIRTEKDLKLYLSGCGLNITGNDTFLFPPTLVTLDLTRNTDITPDPKDWSWMESLINTRIERLILSWTLQYYIPEGGFKYLAKTNIKTLILACNGISYIRPKSNFPNTIEKLDISYNMITLGSLYKTIIYSNSNCLKLKELNANCQRFDKVVKQISQKTDANSGVNINASNTLLKSTCGAERMPSPSKLPDNVFLNGLQILDASLFMADVKRPRVFSKEKENCLRSFEERDRDIQMICLPPDLETIYANSAIYPYDFNSVPHVHIVNNTVLRHVELADNNLTTLLGPIENVPSLQYLDLSQNQCTNLGVDFFKYMASLQTLILEENSIGLSLDADVNGFTFSTLRNLKLLDVSHNSITDLSRSAFTNNRKLKTLDLSSNQLSEFQPTISTILNMSFLDLSHNILPGLSEQTSEELKLLKSRNKHFTIDVLGNRLLFTCDYLPFLHLVLSKPHIFIRVEHLKFKSTNGTKISYKDLAHNFPPLARECLAQRFFDLILIVLFVVVGTVTICAVIYHKRWKLRYLYYTSRRRMHIGEHVADYIPDADVFLTYDQDDLRWRRFMQRTFLPGLNQRNITYILGETDFPGGDVMAHVTGAVIGTRKTVVLLSVDIFDDHHREYEMNLSIMREMDTRSLKIVPIFVEDVDLALYPREIEIFLRNQWERCFRYSDSDDFWDSFVDAVREDN